MEARWSCGWKREWISQLLNSNDRILHNTNVPTNKLWRNPPPQGSVTKGFTRCCHQCPTAIALYRTQRPWLRVVWRSCWCYMPQTSAQLETYLGQAEVCIRVSQWDEILEWKELNFGVDLHQLVLLRRLWGVSLTCQAWTSTRVLLEESYCQNKPWPTYVCFYFVATWMRDW